MNEANRKTILHIGPNSKFTQNHYMRIRDRVEGDHLLFYTSSPSSDSAEFSQTENPYTFILNNPGYFQKCINKCDVAIVHHPSLEVYSALSGLSKDALAIWVTWGGDVYSLLDFQLLKEKTLELKSKFYTKNPKQISNRIRAKILSERYYLYFRKEPIQLSRFDVIFGFPKEINLLNPEMLKPEVVCLPPLFPILAENLGTLASPFADGQGVLISNSTAIENNLLDTCFDLKYYKDLIAIVNYPKDAWRDFLIQEIQLEFPGVHLIREYLDTDSWMSTFASLESIYFATLRNLGFVNILMGIQKGLKIYLDKDNPVYDYLTSNGFTIFTLDQFNSHSGSDFKLSRDTRIKNRERLHQVFSIESYSGIECIIQQHISREDLEKG